MLTIAQMTLLYPKKTPDKIEYQLIKFCCELVLSKFDCLSKRQLLADSAVSLTVEFCTRNNRSGPDSSLH